MNEYIDFCFCLTESSEIINALKTYTIKKIVRRHLQGGIDRFIEEETNLLNGDVFDMIQGSILIYLENGDVIGFDIDEVKDSIVAWFDTHNGAEFDTEHHHREICEELAYDHPVYSHKNKWNHIVGHKLTKISVLEYDRGGRRYYDVCFQKAIILETAYGDMVLSYLPGMMHPFRLIRKSQIPQEIINKSKIIEL